MQCKARAWNGQGAFTQLELGMAMLPGEIFLAALVVFFQPSVSFQLVFCENSSTYRYIFDMFIVGGELHVYLLHRLLTPLHFWHFET